MIRNLRAIQDQMLTLHILNTNPQKNSSHFTAKKLNFFSESHSDENFVFWDFNISPRFRPINFLDTWMFIPETPDQRGSSSWRVWEVLMFDRKPLQNILFTKLHFSFRLSYGESRTCILLSSLRRHDCLEIHQKVIEQQFLQKLPSPYPC